MEMQMRYALAGVGTAVGDHTVAVYKACFLGNARDLGEQIGNDILVCFVNAVNRRDMTFGDYKDVGGCLGIDVAEGEDLVVLIYFT